MLDNDPADGGAAMPGRTRQPDGSACGARPSPQAADRLARRRHELADMADRPRPSQQASVVNRPAGRRKLRMHARPQAGAARFGAYGAELCGQRTWRRRKAATSGQALQHAEGCAPCAVRCRSSAGIVSQRVLGPGCSGPDLARARSRRSYPCPVDVLRYLACGSAGCGWCGRESELRP